MECSHSEEETRIRLVGNVVGDAKRFLAAEGFEPAFGARPLKRLIQRAIGDPLAIAILEGRFVEGDTVTVTVDGPVDNRELVIR